MNDPATYWSAVADTAAFAHPVDRDRFEQHVPKDARVLDVGCGFGRTLAELRDLGWTRLTGVDIAPGMIDRGRSLHPDLDLVVAEAAHLPFERAAFDAVLLFAVLTTIPGDAAQRALVREVRRVLAPGGVVCVSDLFLNTDDRNVQRYDEGVRLRLGPRGCFRLDDGLVCRHHDPVWIDDLFSGFELIEQVPFTAATMRGHTSKAFRLFARRW